VIFDALSTGKLRRFGEAYFRRLQGIAALRMLGSEDVGSALLGDLRKFSPVDIPEGSDTQQEISLWLSTFHENSASWSWIINEVLFFVSVSTKFYIPTGPFWALVT